MSDMPESPFPSPGPEHKKLQEMVGTWSIASEYCTAPGQPPMTSEGREVIEAHGPFWTVSRYEANVMGFAMQGRATLGYDPVRGSWVGTWIDNITPYAYFFTGGYDADGRVLTMTSEAADMHSGKMTTYRTVATEVDADHRVFEMYMTAQDGQEMKLFKHTYTREA